jgi:lipid-A-disaccharide synthase-like uncharacterized protein
MNPSELTSYEMVWLGIGFAGQALFSMRFLIQWLQSERQRRSVIPVAFWYFSIGGGLTLLAYAIYRQDPVFILGQATGIFIYSRNLYFVAQERRKVTSGARHP